MDEGWHALTCRHLGSFGVRHNALRETFLHFLSLAGIPAEREAPSLLPGSAARPADIFVPKFAGTQAACLDFAVTHTQQSNILHCASVCGGAVRSGTRVLLRTQSLARSARRRAFCSCQWWWKCLAGGGNDLRRP